MITIQQKAVLALGCVLVIVMLLFPPMRAKSQFHGRNGKIIRTEFVGHQPLFIKNAKTESPVIETWIDFHVLTIEFIILTLLLLPAYQWKFDAEPAKSEEKPEEKAKISKEFAPQIEHAPASNEKQYPAWLLFFILPVSVLVLYLFDAIELFNSSR